MIVEKGEGHVDPNTGFGTNMSLMRASNTGALSGNARGLIGLAIVALAAVAIGVVAMLLRPQTLSHLPLSVSGTLDVVSETTTSAFTLSGGTLDGTGDSLQAGSYALQGGTVNANLGTGTITQSTGTTTFSPKTTGATVVTERCCRADISVTTPARPTTAHAPIQPTA